MPITPELKAIYASAPSDKTYIETLEFSHPKFSKTWYIVNDEKAWEFFDQVDGASTPKKLVTFQPLAFTVQMPKQDNGGNQELVLAIANAGLDMMDELEAAQTQPDKNIECVYRIYIDVPDTEPQIDPPIHLSISDISVDLQTIQATASRFDILGRQFPTQIYTSKDFPGLVR